MPFRGPRSPETPQRPLREHAVPFQWYHHNIIGECLFYFICFFLQPKTQAQYDKKVERLIAKDAKKRQTLKELGVEYDFAGFAGALAVQKKKKATTTPAKASKSSVASKAAAEIKTPKAAEVKTAEAKTPKAAEVKTAEVKTPKAAEVKTPKAAEVKTPKTASDAKTPKTAADAKTPKTVAKAAVTPAAKAVANKLGSSSDSPAGKKSKSK